MYIYVAFGAVTYDDGLPTGYEGCVYEMSMVTQQTTLVTINPE